MLIEEEEERMARVLRLAGPRPDAAPERHERVRSAAHREWQAMTRRRALRRRSSAVLAVLSAAAALLVIARIGPPLLVTDTTVRPTVGVVERSSALAAGPDAGAGLRAGDWVETTPSGRLALRLAERTSIRLDTETRLQVVTASIVQLERGAVYVDTGVDSSRLEVRTPHGTVRDVGTQFEVRLDDAVLRLRVPGRASSNCTVASRWCRWEPARSSRSVRERRCSPRISPAARDWQWAASLAPVFSIEGRTLADFLDHLAREQGWTFTYADPTLARDASRIVLHGSVSGLSPADALAVVARTSGLAARFMESADSTLVIVSRAVERK